MHHPERTRRPRLHNLRADALLLGAVVVFFPTPAHAYIDPGTGSALLYLVTGIALSLYFGARALYYRIGEMVFRAGHEHEACQLAVHSEDPRYEITFLPVLRALADEGITVSYFTMYERDDSFEELPEGTRHKVIAEGLRGYSYLNKLTADILLTTTPQLDVMVFRRSKRVKHYCYVPHALGESRYVRPYSYDYFDSVMCCGRTIKENIRRIEAIRESAPKTLLETGIPHYDELLKSATKREPEPSKPTILIAPSWGPLSLFECFGTGFVAAIAAKYNVIVRPHPQMRVSRTELYEEILGLEGVTVDTARTPATALASADLLVSDLSGIMHEFAFIYEKPVIIASHESVHGGLEGELLGGGSELRERCRSVIIPIPAEDIHTIVDRLGEILAADSQAKIPAVRDDLVYNFGNAGPVAAKQIKGLLECL